MTLQVNLKRVAELNNIPYTKLWRMVRLYELTPQEAVKRIELERLEGKPSRRLLNDPVVASAKSYVKTYYISLKDAVRALKKVPEEWDNTPPFLGWPLSYWVNNDTELGVIKNMLARSYAMEDILEITGIRLKLHRKRRV